MRLKNCVQNEDGSLDFDFHVDADEAAFLMDFSIKSLINAGLIHIVESESGIKDQDINLDFYGDSEGYLQ
jgi:hypothetical protein